MNGQTYLNMTNDDIVTEMMIRYNYNLFNDNLFGTEVWWFQDGAPCHRTIHVTDQLRELFGDQVVSLHHNTEWPPRSPDLTSFDFFLWGYIKSKVYLTPPADIFDLRNRIIDEFTNLENNDLIERSVRGMLRRAYLCLQRGGGHVEGSFE